MKTYNVNSIYKNPDRYIERLKKEIEWGDERVAWRDEKLNRSAERVKELENKVESEKILHEKAHWFSYTSEEGIEINFHSSNSVDILKKIDINEEVLFIGKITEKLLSNKDNTAKFSFHSAYVHKLVKDR